MGELIFLVATFQEPINQAKSNIAFLQSINSSRYVDAILY